MILLLFRSYSGVAPEPMARLNAFKLKASKLYAYKLRAAKL